MEKRFIPMDNDGSYAGKSTDELNDFFAQKNNSEQRELVLTYSKVMNEILEDKTLSKIQRENKLKHLHDCLGNVSKKQKMANKELLAHAVQASQILQTTKLEYVGKYFHICLN